MNSLTVIWLKDRAVGDEIAQLSWVADGMTTDESDGLARLHDIARADLGLAKSTVERPWFVDGGAGDGWSSLEVVHGIASEDLALAIRLMKHPWLVDDGPSDQWRSLGFLLGIVLPDSKLLGEAIGSPLPTHGATYLQRDGLALMRTIAQLDLGLAGQIVCRPWFAEGDSAEEWSLIWPLHDLAKLDIELAKATLAFPWITDGISEDELEALYSLDYIAQADVELGRLIANYPWIIDGVSDVERQTLKLLLDLAGADLELARSRATVPSLMDGASDVEFVRLALGLSDTAGDLAADLTEDMRGHLVKSLVIISGIPNELVRLGTKPWSKDGIVSEEAALVVALSVPALVDSALLYGDLLQSHFVQTRAISLPLAGEVNIWIIQNAPFAPDDESLTIIEDTARIAEGLFGAPFPTTDIVLLHVERVDVGKNYSLPNTGQFFGHVMAVTKTFGEPTQTLQRILRHETAHYYFHTGPSWFNEGGARFIESYVDHHKGVQDLAETMIQAAHATQRCSNHFENILHLTHVDSFPFCLYDMSHNYLLTVFDSIGEEAFSSALRELHSWDRKHDQPVTEEAIYHAFLNHAPVDRKELFRELYRRLHGGQFGYPHTDSMDLDGDEATAATDVDVGDIIVGSLDNWLDFDYFRFQAKVGQKYRINVNHDSLRVTSVRLYSPDGLAFQDSKSRKQTLLGPEILWRAPNSDEYFVAVQNYGGKTGAYVLTIAAVDDAADDHGDNAASATNIAIGRTIEASLDDDFDYDFFRFQVVEGEKYRAIVTNSKRLRFEVYLSDGVIYPEYNEVFNWTWNAQDGTIELVGNRRIIEWVALSDGDLYFAIEDRDGNIAAYTLTIELVDDGPGS